ncbi:MAG: hypothetical protein HKN70_01495 [Gammaproteobacteria bacterium]|nr:hypothetical protein [Gammaproteobacteria bacterium]
MPESLVLRVNSSSTQHHSWVVVDGNGTRIGDVSFGDLHSARQLADNRQLIVLLPAAMCLVTSSNLPLKNPQKLLQALPFELEDLLIGDIDDTHFAVGPRDSAGRFPVAVVRRDELDALLLTLADHDLHPAKIIPEVLTLPSIDGGCTVLLEESEAIIRTPDGNAVLMDPESLGAAIQLASFNSRSDADASSTDDHHLPVTVYIDDSSGVSGEQAIADLHQEFPNTEFRRLPHGALSKLGVMALHPDHPNLLQGAYAPSTNFEKLLEPWRYAATAVAVLLAVTIGYKALELHSMKNRYAEINTAMLELAKNTFPQRPQITRPLAVFREAARASQVGGAAGSSEFIEMLEIVSQAAGENAGLSVSRLNYRPGNLDLEITAPNVQTLDSLTNSITEQDNWSASLQSTKPDGDAVVGRMSIQGNQP